MGRLDTVAHRARCTARDGRYAARSSGRHPLGLGWSVLHATTHNDDDNHDDDDNHHDDGCTYNDDNYRCTDDHNFGPSHHDDDNHHDDSANDDNIGRPDYYDNDNDNDNALVADTEVA